MNFKNISPEALRDYVKRHREQDYVLIDVRQPTEYTQGHIPGARLIPLDQLEAEPSLVPKDRNVFFYCRSGARSQAAAILLLDDLDQAPPDVYSLNGGMLGWDGQALSGFPRLQAFDQSATLPQQMHQAMNMEKAALRFYRHVARGHADRPYAPVIVQLQKAEKAHARTIYDLWRRQSKSATSFETLFEELAGDVLEGGEPLAKALARIGSSDDGDCLSLMEFALQIEIQAYDLYRSMADATDEKAAQQAFLAIAQMEKKHMQWLSDVFRQC